MEASTRRKELEQQKQAEIRRQIALLQAQLTEDTNALPDAPATPKRKQPTAHILAARTPSPKKRKTSHEARERPSAARPTQRVKPTIVATKAASPVDAAVSINKPAPSTLLQKLAAAHTQRRDDKATAAVNRSSSFTDKPAVVAPQVDGSGQMRDERLALVENLTLGSAEHKAPFDDPRFEKLEPNSGIRLASREMPHEDLQEYIRGRYYLSPSKLYSVIRLLPNKQGYDVPVDGDWVTIAVVAERGKVKQSQAPVGVEREDKVDHNPEDTVEQLPLDTPQTDQAKRAKGKQKKKPPKPAGKKYINIKLVDFGCRTRSSSTTGGQAVIRGDASLSLLLFESDSYDVVTRDDGRKERIYKGGSRGAFEKMSMLKEGTVVALLNPRILRPFQRSADTPHPTDNILAITPESVGSIAVIGRSQDLGMCTAIKRDGSVCGSWCDKRVADVCEWHIQHAIERKRAGRAEFSSGTSGMSTGAKRKKIDYDPAKQWGLKPPDQNDSGGTTYVVSGHVVSGGADRKLFLSESIGRDAQAKASRLSAKDADRALQKLLKRDKEGTKALMTAREFGKRASEKVGNGGDKGEENSTRQKAQGKDAMVDLGSDSDDEHDDDKDKKPVKNVYSAQLIRQLGFDPTAKGRDGKKAVDETIKSKLDALAASQASRKAIELGPRPGRKLTCVKRPNPVGLAAPRTSPEVYLTDSDDDELEKGELAVFGRNVSVSSSSTGTLVDLDSSDLELDVESPA